MAIDYNTGEVEYNNTMNYAKRKDPRPPSFKPDIEEGREILVIPGEAKTIKELMENALRGIEPDQRRYPYFDQEDLDAIDEFYSPSMDLTDLDRLNDKVNRLKQAVENAQQKKQEMEQEEPQPEPQPEPAPEPDN